jgi:hypothetical protein
MDKINVLIVVDVEGALTSGNLGTNVYLIDTTKYAGSGNEGQDELYTACISNSQGGSPIAWSVAPVDPSTTVSINSFTGTMITSKALIPVVYPDGSWEGTLQSNLSAGDIQYSVVLNFENGKTMTFDPFLKVSNS